MQEEVTQKTIALAISTTKMTSAVLAKALRKLLEEQKNKSHQLPKGKQTLKNLMKQNTAISNLEITNDNIKAFSSTAKKYGLDFSLKKDSSTDPPRYLVFFKGRDADVMTAAFQEFTAKHLSQEKKPSIRKLLSSMKELAKQKSKVLDRSRQKDRGVEL
ncbi:PcfB family protein [[Clostridium] scindens]|uniref:PcfB family protein n=1 Tax=Clostridium scindens (strain JCM 10418 / VPI 12708) TaxID=29347 RepID=UPI003AF0FB0F